MCTKNQNSAVMVMKSTENRSRSDGTEALNSTMNWGILVQRSMGPQFIIVARVGLQDPT